MATLLDYAVHLAVERDGLPRVASYDDGLPRVLYLDAAIVQSMLTADWLATRGPLPSEPTPGEITTAITAHEAARQTAIADAAALRQQILTLAQSAVGVRLADLTVAQRNALIAILLWKEGALKNDLTVRALAEWVKG